MTTLEKPPGGGRYVRNSDGSLTEVQPPTAPPGTPKPSKKRKAKEPEPVVSDTTNEDEDVNDGTAV